MIRFSVHAAARMRERGIDEAWVADVLEAPERVQADPTDPTFTRSFRAIPAAGSRILRVVHRPAGQDTLVITAFLDRDAVI